MEMRCPAVQLPTSLARRALRQRNPGQLPELVYHSILKPRVERFSCWLLLLPMMPVTSADFGGLFIADSEPGFASCDRA